jgi:hypothetical protein
MRKAKAQAHTEMLDRVLIGTSFMAIAVPTVMFSFAMLVR